MNFINILRDILAIIIIGLFSFFVFYSFGKNFIEIISILLTGLYLFLMHRKNTLILNTFLITLSIFVIIILSGLSNNITGIMLLSFIFLLILTINLFNPTAEESLQEKKPKDAITLSKIDKITSSSKFNSEIKKEKVIRKEFDVSDHNKFMPK